MCPWPLHSCTVADPQSRRLILSDAEKVKEAGEIFKKIYIKRDMHPSFGREMGRMRQSPRHEK